MLKPLILQRVWLKQGARKSIMQHGNTLLIVGSHGACKDGLAEQLSDLFWQGIVVTRMLLDNFFSFGP
tara:strand:+ start:248 stop:451 length:204 start_codon:yes stop_codon:yes gene_type:complete